MPSDDDIALVDRRRLRWEPTDSNTLLGEGSFGIVYSGRFNGTPVAIKVIKRPPPAENASDDDRLREHAALKQHRREIHRFKVVQNPYIIQYLGVFRGEHPRDLYIVTEYLEGGSLHDSLSKMRARKAILDDRSFLQVATHIARGLNHVHASQYTHGDMKPQNILLTSAFQFSDTDKGNIAASIPASAKVKIADFGLSKRLDGAESASIFGSTTATTDFGTGPCGTYLYMSPEAYEGISRLTDSQAKAADVYAFALVLFELLSGLQSWGYERVRNPMQLSAFVRSGKRPAWGPRQSQIDPAYIDLVTRCWSQNADERPTVDEIVGILEDQQNMYDRRKSEMVKSPSSQAFSDVTKQDAFSPDFLYQKDDNEIPHHVAEPRSSGNIGDPDGHGNVPSRGSTPVPDLCEVEECERIDTKVDSEDDAHTLGEGEDVFGSQELNDFEAPDDFEQPPIKPVISMRLTPTEVELYRSKQAPKAYVEAEDSDSERTCSDTDSEACRQDDEDSDDDEPDIEGAIPNAVSSCTNMNGKADLDSQENDSSRFMDSIAGPVTQVESFMVPLPEHEELNLPENDRPVWGLGSDVEKPDSRTNSMIMKSMLAVSLNDMTPKGVPQNERNAPAGQGNEKVSQDATSLSEQLNSVHLALAPSQPLVPSEPNESEENSKENISTATGTPKTPEETADGPTCAAQQGRTKTYTSPTVEESEIASFFPGTEIPVHSTEPRPSNGWPLSQVPDRPQVSNYVNGYSHQPNPYGSLTEEEASAPPLSGTSQSAMGVGAAQVPHQMPNRISSPAWASPGSNYSAMEPNHRIPTANLNPNMLGSGHSVDNSAVVAALQRHNAAAVLRDWWNRGFTRAVSSGLAQAHDIGGEELLDLVRDFTARNNGSSQERKDPLVARDLCASIGHIARNSSRPLGQHAITRTVRDVLLVLPTFNYLGVARTEVFSFANFALCNLFKVYNVIQDFQLRNMTASWITYVLSWNTSPGKEAPFDQVLAYTATSAARNFMWMNEDNVRAFVECNSNKGYGAPPASVTLISSMMYFDWKGGLSVVEASLSAMAMIVHFPRQRGEFMKAHGADAVMDVLSKHAGNSGITSLALWMVTVLFSGPAGGQSHEEAETIRRLFIDGHGCQKFVKALERVDQLSGSEKQKVENLENGYNALLAVARFGGSLRAHLIEAGCMPMILKSVRQVGSSLSGHYGSEEEILVRKRLGMVLFELVREMSNEHKGKSYMQDNNVRHPLESMMRIHGSDDGFTSRCRVALTSLAY